MRHSSEIDMCSGPLAGSLLRFSLPLMASSILQLLFNAADIIVLGQFASSSAMAAVGATSSLNSLMVNLFLGLSIGCSVVMARSLFVLYLSYPVTWTVTCAAHLVCYAIFYRRLRLPGQATLHS